MKRSEQGTVSRARWAALGAAVAVSLGVGGVAVTNAIVSSGERTAFIPITPCRLFDLRPAPSQVGPRSAPLGPHEVYTVQVTGINGNCNLPADASAVAMNVTTVNGTGASYLTVWPADVAQPLASNLNWVPGSPPTPNKVDVRLSATGAISLYNDVGSVAVLADVVGYYVDHNHDDRYYTKAEISSDITMSNDVMLTNNSAGGVTSLQFFTGRSRASGDGTVQLALSGPRVFAGTIYGLKSVTYCFEAFSGAPVVNSVTVTGNNPLLTASDSTNRATTGCYTVTVNHGSPRGFLMSFGLSGGGSWDLLSINTTWSPASLLPASAPEAAPTGPETGL